jgi:hypothetical protein
MASAALDWPGFFDVPKHTVRVGAGEIELPIAYRDATATTVFFPAQPRVARELVEPHGLSPVRLPLGALLAITWFEYRDTGIGPYNELGISLLVTPTKRKRGVSFPRGNGGVGFHVLHLPVTTETARSGGVELYGYPKAVNEIPMRVGSDAIEGTLRDAGRDVLSMRIPLRRGLGLRMIDLTTYSVLDGYLMKTVVPTACRARAFQAKGTELRLLDDAHPICRTLRRLMPRPWPRWVLHADPFRSLLPLPVAVARLPQRSAA